MPKSGPIASLLLAFLMAAPASAHGPQQPPPEPQPPEPQPPEPQPPTISRSQCTDYVISLGGKPWRDASGRSGTAVPTFGHLGCPEIDCSSGVWPDLFGGIAGARWIWKKRLITEQEAQRGDTVSFFDQFCLPSGAEAFLTPQIVINADNAYKIFYVDQNNVRQSPQLLASGNEWRKVGSHELPLPTSPTGNPLSPGECQRFEIEVENFGIPGSNGNVNPAGLIYTLINMWVHEFPPGDPCVALGNSSP